MRKVLSALAALSLTTMTVAPAMAADNARATAPASGESDILGGTTLLFLVAAAVAIAGIVIIADDGNSPDSP